jgi:hypothetical protein
LRIIMLDAWDRHVLYLSSNNLHVSIRECNRTGNQTLTISDKRPGLNARFPAGPYHKS